MVLIVGEAVVKAGIRLGIPVNVIVDENWSLKDTNGEVTQNKDEFLNRFYDTINEHNNTKTEDDSTSGSPEVVIPKEKENELQDNQVYYLKKGQTVPLVYTIVGNKIFNNNNIEVYK